MWVHFLQVDGICKKLVNFRYHCSTAECFKRTFHFDHPNNSTDEQIIIRGKVHVDISLVSWMKQKLNEHHHLSNNNPH